MSYLEGDLTDPFIMHECAFDHPIKKYNADVQLLITVDEEFNVVDLLSIYCVPNQNVLRENRIKMAKAFQSTLSSRQAYVRQQQIIDDVKKYETLVNAVAQGNYITCSYDYDSPF